MFAPICLFTYNRLSETQQTVKALSNNYLATESELFIFSDGPKNQYTKDKVADVRYYLPFITGFKSVEIIESPVNKGLANSIIDGVTQIIEKCGRVIVLEDDLITSPNFLNFMNQALDFYNDNEKIFSISGYTMDLPSLKKHVKDYYLGYRASSWGWGTWIDRWHGVNWLSDYNSFKWDLLKQIKFMRGGSDMPYMLLKQVKGEIDSWAIRWCYHQFKMDQLTIFPNKSKVINIGFGDSATHTKRTKRFTAILDNGYKTDFKFDHTPLKNSKLVKEFRNRFSIISRLKDQF